MKPPVSDREALTRLRDAVRTYLWADATKGLGGELAEVMRAHDIATEALAAPPPLDGLDVERLARAVASAGVHIDVRDPLMRTEPCDSCARGVRVIASEYADHE